MSLRNTLAIGGAVRFLVPALIPQLSAILAETAEVSTPIDSFKSVKEAFFYLENDIDLYDGAMIHHPPILVNILKLLNDLVPPEYAHLVFSALYTVVDLGTAYKLTQLSSWYNAHHSKRCGRVFQDWSPHVIASFYLFNPLILLTNWSHSTAIFSYFLIIELLVQALVDANMFRGAIALGVATYLSFNNFLLIIPYLGLSYAVAKQRDWPNQIVRGFGIFCFSLFSLVGISFALSALADFVFPCYWSVILFQRISPNLGLWWYIFTEMFDFFTPLYQTIFNLYAAIFMFPITLRFFEYTKGPKTGDSFLAFFICYVWISFSKSYPIIGDLGLAISWIPIFANTVIPHTKFLFITTLALILHLLLSPIFYYCWIVLGNGNSNFFYSMSLLWGAVHILLLLDIIWGRLVFDYLEVNKVDDPSSLRLTQI